jgi:hypothetical protein
MLAGTPDPDQRAVDYQEAVQRELRPFYDLMQRQDRTAIRRARAALTPDYRPSLKARLAKSFVEDAITIAIRRDTRLMREAMRGFHMLEHPEAWLKKPGNMAKVLLTWARGRKRNASAYPPKPGPEREDMMRGLGLDPQADIALAMKAA